MEIIAKNEVKEVVWPGKTFIASRATLPFDKLPVFFQEKYSSIYSAIAKLGLQANEPPCAIYYSVDEALKVTDLAAAVAISGNLTDAAGFERIVIPTSKAITATHYGPYESMAETYARLEGYMTAHRLKRKWVLEQYLSDPGLEKDPANWKTNIFFIL